MTHQKTNRNGLPEFQLTIQPEWIDHNGHMNVAYYVLAFDQATDAVYETWDIGMTYPDRGYSVFTLGMNVDYLRELFAGDKVRITTHLLDWDSKRIHYFHEMYHLDSGERVATNECLCINVELDSRRSAPFPEDVQMLLKAVHAAHQAVGVPPGAFRQLQIRR